MLADLLQLRDDRQLQVLAPHRLGLGRIALEVVGGVDAHAQGAVRALQVLVVLVFEPGLADGVVGGNALEMRLSRLARGNAALVRAAEPPNRPEQLRGEGAERVLAGPLLLDDDAAEGAADRALGEVVLDVAADADIDRDVGERGGRNPLGDVAGDRRQAGRRRRGRSAAACRRRRI